MPRAKKVTTSIYCNRYKPNSEGLCVVSIRLHWNGTRRTYDTGYKMTPKEFDALFPPVPTKAQSADLEILAAGGKLPDDRAAAIVPFLVALKKLSPDQRTVVLALSDEEIRAVDIIKSLGTMFTWDRFERSYLSNISISDLLFDAFDGYIDTIEEDRYSTRTSYRDARNRFQKFRPNVKLGDVTVNFLHAFERSILMDDGSISTVGIYCRSLRSVLNWAIAERYISRELYPFGKAKDKKYEIPSSRNPKKALTKEQIAAIFQYECEPGSMEQKCRDYWVFMYMANGINMKDFCLLQWKDLSSDGITFVREKTKRTRRIKEPVTIIVQPEMMEIIRRWGNPNKAKEQYIFPHLDLGMSAEAIRKGVNLVTKIVNKYMKGIAGTLGINRPVRSNDARHSFATILKNNGAPLAMISEALAHSSLSTTQNYFASFETDQIREQTSVLTSFIHKRAAN